MQAKYNQTLVDMAMQSCGDAGRLVELAALNGLSITDDIEAGDTILTPDAAADKLKLVTLLNKKNNEPGSGTQTLSAPEGISYWIIETDFTIQ